MSNLPKIKYPIYSLTLPSNGKVLQYRPYTVKEEKILHMAGESASMADAITNIKQVIHNCVVTEFDVDTAPQFDIEYVFLRLRAVSSSNMLKLMYENHLCKPEEDSKCEKVISFDIDLNDVGIEQMLPDGRFHPYSSQEFGYRDGKQMMLTDTIGVKMKFPSFSNMDAITNVQNKLDANYKLMMSCISAVFDNATVHTRTDFTEEDLIEFFESIPLPAKKQMEDFMNQIPTLRKVISWTCPHCNKTTEVKLVGLKDFFD